MPGPVTDCGLYGRPRGAGALAQSQPMGAGRHDPAPAARLHLGTSIQAQRVYCDGAGGLHLTLRGRPRRDSIRSFSLSVVKRAFTVFGYSPQLALIHEARLTSPQAQGCDRNRAELRLARQF